MAATLALSFVVGSADAATEFGQRAMEIEKQLHAQPFRSLADLEALIAASGGTPAERRFAQALHGQAMILTGRSADALALADRLANDAATRPDDLTLATALMLRSRVQLSFGDAAMEEALAIARAAQSHVIEGHALINLADIQLRRNEFREALELSRRSLQLATEFGEARAIATSKANMGFALFGLGRVAEGRRLADEALAEYERSGATAEIASLLGEYGIYLERAGEHQAALALFHRAHGLHEQIAAAASEKALLEIQEKYESDERKREIALLNSENALKSAALETRELQQRIWWLLAAVFAVSFAIVVALYRKLRVTNRLLAQTNSELSVRSSRDPLTALYNRRYFQDFMRDERARPDRRRRRDSETATRALLLIDIDHFKQINDRHGHAAGDAVLVVVARRLRDSLRETDMIVRWGGEEFLVFIPATTHDRLDEIAMRIMHAVSSEPVMFQGAPIRVTASVGYAPMPLPPHGLVLPWDRAIGLVDMALYMAKVHGRNRAYGISGLSRGDDEALSRIERDLEQSWREGMVEMRALPGPDFYVYGAAGSSLAIDGTRH